MRNKQDRERFWVRIDPGVIRLGLKRRSRPGERERETTDFLRVEYAGNTLLSGFAHTCKDNKSRWWKKSWPRAITDELARSHNGPRVHPCVKYANVRTWWRSFNDLRSVGIFHVAFFLFSPLSSSVRVYASFLYFFFLSLSLSLSFFFFLSFCIGVSCTPVQIPSSCHGAAISKERCLISVNLEPQWERMVYFFFFFTPGIWGSFCSFNRFHDNDEKLPVMAINSEFTDEWTEPDLKKKTDIFYTSKQFNCTLLTCKWSCAVWYL